jgi:hypothetical protein
VVRRGEQAWRAAAVQVSALMEGFYDSILVGKIKILSYPSVRDSVLQVFLLGKSQNFLGFFGHHHTHFLWWCE